MDLLSPLTVFIARGRNFLLPNDGTGSLFTNEKISSANQNIAGNTHRSIARNYGTHWATLQA